MPTSTPLQQPSLSQGNSVSSVSSISSISSISSTAPQLPQKEPSFHRDPNTTNDSIGIETSSSSEFLTLMTPLGLRKDYQNGNNGSFNVGPSQLGPVKEVLSTSDNITTPDRSTQDTGDDEGRLGQINSILGKKGEKSEKSENDTAINDINIDITQDNGDGINDNVNTDHESSVKERRPIPDVTIPTQKKIPWWKKLFCGCTSSE
jgi:hypothetical protein